MTLDDLLDPEALAVAVEDGLVARKEGPEGLTLYNYTARAQYGRTWTPETINCRGLVVRDDWGIQSRPFPKFFNVGEHGTDLLPALPAEPFEVFEKMDGSLIVASRFAGRTLLTSRGSFESIQAIAAEELWAERYADVVIPEGETWCFELIAPWNRIVVNYGDRFELVLLARIDTETGRDLPWPDEWPGAIVRVYDGLEDFDVIAAQLAELGPNDEGYVLRFASGLRAKAKGDEYVRLHRLLTGVSARTIWECFATGIPIDDLVERVPDEFYDWVQNTASGLREAYADIEAAVLAKHDEIATLPTRKDQALALADFEHRSCVFRHLDGRPFDDQVWKVLRPAADRPFVLDAEA